MGQIKASVTEEPSGRLAFAQEVPQMVESHLIDGAKTITVLTAVFEVTLGLAVSHQFPAPVSSLLVAQINRSSKSSRVDLQTVGTARPKRTGYFKAVIQQVQPQVHFEGILRRG